MYYVYSKHIKSGKELFCGVYDNAEDAIKKIARNYSVDKTLKQLGEYYYFMKRH